MTPQTRADLNGALRSRGALCRRDILDLGITDAEITGLVRRGELIRPHRNTFASAGARRDRLQTVREDVASMQPEAFAARATALWLHDPDQRIVPFAREILSSTTNGPERPEPPIVHRTRSLSDDDVTIVYGVPTTTIERTLIDLSPDLSEVERLSLLDRIMVKGLSGQAVMHDRACILQRGRGGVADLARATDPDAAALFFSRLERIGRPLLIRAGLDDVVANAVPRRAPEAERCDAVSERHGVVVEWDGLRFHSSPESRQADNDKQNTLVGRYVLLRFTWKDQIERPGYIVSLAQRAMG